MMSPGDSSTRGAFEVRAITITPEASRTSSHPADNVRSQRRPYDSEVQNRILERIQRRCDSGTIWA